MKKTALLSVHDKTELEALAKALSERGYDLLSSSGSAARIRESGLPVREVSDLTDSRTHHGGTSQDASPEDLGGILARRGHPWTRPTLNATIYPMIDMVVCNLYPFEETAKLDSSLEDLLDNIDIGGVSLIELREELQERRRAHPTRRTMRSSSKRSTRRGTSPFRHGNARAQGVPKDIGVRRDDSRRPLGRAWGRTRRFWPEESVMRLRRSCPSVRREPAPVGRRSTNPSFRHAVRRPRRQG